MIIVDFSQVCISSITTQLKNGIPSDEKFIRHVFLNTLRSIISKYKGKYGEVVIACDNKNYWRKEIFPYYKASRKENMEKSNFDWELIFNILSKMKMELKEYFPYRVIEVEQAEADDIIATLTERFGSDIGDGVHGRILIVSGDKDFVQLQKYSNVDQYDPKMKRNLRTDNPELTLADHIIYGDSSDGIPNILSDDACFIEKRRQKSVTSKRYDTIKDYILKGDALPEEIEKNLKRNRSLIDLSMIPSNIKEKINKSYDEGSLNKDKSKLMSYMINYKLPNLIENIQDF